MLIKPLVNKMPMLKENNVHGNNDKGLSVLVSKNKLRMHKITSIVIPSVIVSISSRNVYGLTNVCSITRK
jgi:hypothetical protein